ncbi:MAG: DNA alkylation repair protein [Thermoanaerobaculia bacterium]
MKRAPARAMKTKASRSVEEEVRSAIAWLKSHSTRRTLEGMARYGLPSGKAFGVSMADIQALGKRLGRNHELAAGLWATGWYEARMLTSYVDEPERVTRAQMDRWCRDFDNWGICDTVCFVLFDKTPFAWEKARQWSTSPREFIKRAAFALMASLAGHDKAATDAQFRALLPSIERGARDERNFVKKGVSWALRRIGRRSPALHAAALPVAKRLAQSEEAACRWVGTDALRELSSTKVRSALDRRNARNRQGDDRWRTPEA